MCCQEILVKCRARGNNQKYRVSEEEDVLEKFIRCCMKWQRTLKSESQSRLQGAQLQDNSRAFRCNVFQTDLIFPSSKRRTVLPYKYQVAYFFPLRRKELKIVLKNVSSSLERTHRYKRKAMRMPDNFQIFKTGFLNVPGD